MAFWSRRKQGAERRELPLLDVLQHMVVPIFVLDRAGQVVLWNKACATLTGLEASAVLGTSEHWRGFYQAQRPCLADLVLAGSTGQANQLYAAANAPSTDGSAVAQNWCDLPNGNRRYLRIDAGPLRDANGDTAYVVETLQDMTAMKEAECAIQAERESVARDQGLVVGGLADGLERLSGGNLLFRLSSAFPAEYEKLRTDFNAAMDTLQRTMQAIAGNTSGVRASAGSITQSSDDLSHRTEQQAASLEQTAAALDEITATVRKTADSANEARDVVGKAREDAERSGNVVNETVTAMAGIEESSRQISNIIGVIDEIAFQTNLLALNAGVEAARAGDAGRGFAVVATEVRALAQRSAVAAKEIKALISTSGTQVQSGVRLVGATGEALARIVAQVERLNMLVSDIAASAVEQATGLAQVNSAVNQMDQVTQQNAAMVEEATAAGHALKEEAHELARLVGQFQIGEAHVAAALHGAKTKPALAPARSPAPARAPASAGGKFVRLSAPVGHGTEEWGEF
jgi:methyl-accepting chemotaxis protein